MSALPLRAFLTRLQKGGPARAPTARAVVWDTAAIPGDEPPASPAWGKAMQIAPLFSYANVTCFVGLPISMQTRIRSAYAAAE